MAKWGLGLGIAITSLAVIGILAAMILVALSSAREKARNAIPTSVNYVQQLSVERL